MKKYLRMVPHESSSVIEKYVLEVRHPIEWVDSPEEATALDRTAAEEIQGKLKQQLGLDTELVESPDHDRIESRWVITKEDS